MTTELQYLEDMFRLDETATIVEVAEAGASATLVLDRTIFFPQGGGQPCDTGVIRGEAFSSRIERVIYVDGRVLHEGRTSGDVPRVGQPVALSVDAERRREASARQSAGHLLLNAMRNAGQMLVATKGYHFPDGPYVEFSGAVPETDREALLERLQHEIDRLIEADLPIVAAFVEPSRLYQVCAHVPANVPLDKPTRVVTIDDFSQPCGGTHVRSTGELAGMKVEKIRTKKGDTRVSYRIDPSR